MISHVRSLRFSPGYSGPFPTLSNASCTSRFSPHLLVANASVWATSLLGVAVTRVLCIFFFPLPVMLPSEIPKLPTDPMVRGFPGVWKLLLFYNSLPGWVSIPNFFVSLFIFYIFSYLLLKTMDAFLGAWCPLPAFRSCFVEVAQHLNDLLMNLWGRKWSSCPISPPSWGHLTH